MASLLAWGAVRTGAAIFYLVVDPVADKRRLYGIDA
jgi:hypothetical protein